MSESDIVLDDEAWEKMLRSDIEALSSERSELTASYRRELRRIDKEAIAARRELKDFLDEVQVLAPSSEVSS